MRAYEKLEQRYQEIAHLEHVMSMSSWDESVMMPVGGGAARAAALSTLSGLQHQLKVDPRIADELAEAKEQPLDIWQKRNIELIEKSYINATIVPTTLVKAMTQASMQCQQQWRVCRANNDWAGLKPYLETSFSLVKEAAQLRAAYWQCDAYDVMIDDYMPGFNQQAIDPLFSKLEQVLPVWVDQITARAVDNPVLPIQGPFSASVQKLLSERVMKQLQFDFKHGRLDTTVHPFCGGVPDDVRVTTQYDERDLCFSLMAVCHETGHALYEQGLPTQWRIQPVGRSLGMAVHESQSLFVEMQLCRSLAFYQWCCPIIEEYFGARPGLNPENLFRINTEVKPSLIRITADEVTYPLHVILRYQLEKKLFSGDTYWK